MENHNVSAPPSGAAKYVLIALLLSLAAAVFPFALLLVPAYFAYAAMRTHPALLLLFSAALFAAASVLWGAYAALWFALGTLLIAAAVYAMQSRRLGNANTCAVAAAFAVFAIYGAVCLPGILSGEGAFTAMQALFSEAVGEWRAVAAVMFAETPAATMAGVNEYLDLVEQTAVDMIVPMFCSAGMVLGLSNVLFFRLFAKKGRIELAPMRPFRKWSIPRTYTVGILVMLVGSMIMELTGVSYAASLSSTVNVLVGFPLILQGLAVIDDWIVRKGGGVTGKRILIYALCAVFFAFLQTVLVILGCAEQLFRFRARRDGTYPPSPAEPQ